MERYAGRMMHAGMKHYVVEDFEADLRAGLAEEEALVESTGPILHHFLASDDHSLFSDEVVARVRGMVAHVAEQLLVAQAEAGGVADAAGFVAEARDELVLLLLENAGLLHHLHCLSLEWRLADQIHRRNAIDPVLSPLIQAEMASPDGANGATAMALLAAQARFNQHQRRMELPLTELPGDLFHIALLTLRGHAASTGDSSAEMAERQLRAAFDESRGRLGLAARFITAMEGDAMAALSVAHAGVALFLTALAMASGQSRTAAIMATAGRGMTRLALSLRAAGLKPGMIEEQLLVLHPDVVLPEEFGQLRPDRAAALLAAAAPAGAG